MKPVFVRYVCTLATFVVASTAAPARAATGYNFVDISYPGVTGVTGANGLNDSGQIVGTYTDTPGSPRRGFLFSAGVFSPIDYPGAVETIPLGINADGGIVGVAQSCTGNGYGCSWSFTLVGGVFTVLPDAPGSLPGATFAWAINESGEVAGYYVDICFCRTHSFTFNGGVYTTVDRPGYFNTQSRGLNDLGELPGTSFPIWGGSAGNGFIFSQGSFSAFDVPGATGGTEVTGVNNTGDFAGNYSTDQMHAFVVIGGALTLIDHPDATQQTSIWGQAINASRQLVGTYVAADGITRSFLATPIPTYSATVQPPINSNGSSVFNAKRGVVPVKFTLTANGVATCQLPAATISVVRSAGGTLGSVNESVYTQSSDDGSNFRISDCQYVYNLGAAALGQGTYVVTININNAAVGSASFFLK